MADENYSRLETTAGERRERMQITTTRMNAAAMWLYGDNSNFNNQDRARGALRMTQFISEAARFRPIRDEIALSLSPTSFGFVMSPELVRQENNWDNLSRRFNWLLRQRAGFRDPNPLVGYRRDGFNQVVRIVLTTAVLYAQYILATSKDR
ncbi:hypothetical protein SGFS_097490 [Streptomyces graminofaciens]|uniref:Uncharacterized protein n=1 Tax=Streptomyces graminofaciens TaxID=68212 RepID=A0ABM7FP74_9ACTN|nr:ribosome-inactivating family protein [Streptomyces graminofaciens]BBC38455.1 hypothetical protein SGFS_097490 [Streptomyces graminofaciens]